MKIDLQINMQGRFNTLARSYGTDSEELARLIVESWTMDAGHGHPVLYSAVTEAARAKRMAVADAKTARHTRKMIARNRKAAR